MVFELVSFDVATQHSHRSPSADCSHLKWKSPNGTPDNTVRIAMTIPTQIRNQPFVSYTFLTFQIDTRQSLAASTSGKLAATIHELQLIELIGGRRTVPFLSKVESIIFDSRSASLCSPGRNCDSITPSAHNRCSHDNRASKCCTRPTPRLAAIARPAVISVFTLHLQRHVALRQNTADLQGMSNIFCRDVLTLRCRQRHDLLCRRIRLQQITTKISPSARRQQSLQFPFPICLFHHSDLALHFFIWKTPAVHGCYAVMFTQASHQPKPVCASDRKSERNLQRSMPLFCARLPLLSRIQGQQVHRLLP